MNRGNLDNLQRGRDTQSSRALAHDTHLLRCRGSLDSFQFAALVGCSLRRARRRLYRLERCGEALRVPGSRPSRFVPAL